MCTTIIDLSKIDIDKIDKTMMVDMKMVEGPCGSYISNTRQVNILTKHLHFDKMFSNLALSYEC